MSGGDDDSDKSFEPTAQKLQKAREKGEVAKSTDLSVAAAYLGLVVALYVSGSGMVEGFGTVLISLLDQPDRLAQQMFTGAASAPVGGILMALVIPILPIFILPFGAVLLSILAQRALVFAPSKLEPKMSKISIISNAKNKFGRAGLFEFLKSFVKLVLYSICLGVYLSYRLPEMIASSGTGAFSVVAMLAQLGMEFLIIALLLALPVGVVDAVFQHAEHIRKNMMSRQEIQDEVKDSEGDPHVKGQRRQKGQQIAMGQMMADVPKADVVIVNPTHYAVALQWSREKGSAPKCVAKGVDEVAAAIRRVANEHAVPIHSDPPTARALHATIEIGEEIMEEHYAPVAAAIRFAEAMRQRAKGGV
ncbi:MULTISPECIES: flagellar type III secretion system protein FlhB [Rhodobacterales]|jgi:flagellar biosynthetic protein FlhB|uniref:Flagellar biosynthesis protein FlhB n=1 Tax=Phaeobacter gallaeciensis TaxID=60890 RepID=A0A1B0ZT85_9RHOB|nr:MULTISPECIES: flagellar type III secretion system protein FlhB [Phaeobacter]MDF1772679.1 flagellar type III secretion system protein FlhB [Pseudophaeobacter sp. bin_em_oilr2.035]ANP37288.1 flagellar biosynthesis protein FlhB [Phaeobacter gallaeciensis]MDE4063268.1 flagellar type III secretion system protein FlhB [Phaeobacter gallaeciensis]MDE4099321.1 flagellar type III secretion system protein FlhB [Phaeobacter gallaeciensis]MDE4108050.1 flagellar type III secretion system protein FlhB [Ph